MPYREMHLAVLLGSRRRRSRKIDGSLVVKIFGDYPRHLSLHRERFVQISYPIEAHYGRDDYHKYEVRYYVRVSYRAYRAVSQAIDTFEFEQLLAKAQVL